MRKIEDKLKVKKLIDSGGELCVISHHPSERTKGLPPVDTEIRWSIGSAKSTMDRVFGVSHSVAVEMDGIKILIPVFILESKLQEFILWRKWDQLPRAQHDNRQDGSLYISFTSSYDTKKPTFCPGADCTDCARDRVYSMRLADNASGEASLGGSLGNI